MVEKDVVETGSKALTFISQVISSTAWPLTILTCVLLLRRHLLTLIPFVRKLKYSDVEIEFGKEVAALVKVADRTSLPNEPSKGSRNSWEDLIVLADLRPRSAIRSAWSRVTEAYLQAAKDRKIEITDLAQTMPMVVGSLLLNEGVISPPQYDLLTKLRILVDDAERASPGSISSESAIEFIGIALRLAASVSPNYG
jgi:hypothetical protein